MTITQPRVITTTIPAPLALVQETTPMGPTIMVPVIPFTPGAEVDNTTSTPKEIKLMFRKDAK